jgi:AraC-like DNA-binding protein
MSFALEVRSYGGGGRHVHPYSQILFPVRGAMQLDIEGVSTVLSGHRVAVVPPEHAHLFEPSRDCKLLVMDVVGSELAKERVPPLLQDDKPHILPIEPWLWRLFQMLAREVDGDARRARGAAEIAMTGLQLIDPNADAPPSRVPRRRLVRVVQSLGEAQHPRSVAELASDAALSQSQFHALFRAMAGQSPKQFQLQKLLDRAVDRLVNSSDPVAVIAQEIGYENVSSFNRIFRRHFGTTPTGFRSSGRDGKR